MARIIRKLVVLTVGAANAFGIFFFLKWMPKTDMFFGHSKGPPEHLLRSVYALAVGKTFRLQSN